MSLIAGVFGKSPTTIVQDSMRAALRTLISREGADRRIEAGDERCFMVKVDIGAFGSSAHVDEGRRGVTFVAGAPLLSARPAWRPRDEDVAALHAAWRRGDWTATRDVTGQFCGAHYAPEKGLLALVGDKLAARPLYWWDGPDYVVFASALRVLVSAPFVRKIANLRSLAETAAFGYALADRTAYVGIRYLYPAEIVTCEDARLDRTRYWSWDKIEPATGAVDVLADASHAAFEAAVARRLGADRTTVAYLSGGLDSRAIVAALRARDVTVHTVTAGRAGSMDAVFAGKVADALGTRHTFVETKRAARNLPDAAIAHDVLVARRASPAPERPRLVWTGDGGSVGTGLVYMSRELVDRCRAGDAAGALACYKNAATLDSLCGVLGPSLARRARGLAAQSFFTELAGYEAADAARKFYLFLLCNDQRRHSWYKFEGVDLVREEIQVPFLDSDYLVTMMHVPIDEALNHRFYMRWMERFGTSALSVPWQTYPGHLPCPLPVDPGLIYQWAPARTVFPSRDERRRLVALLGKRRFYDRRIFATSRSLARLGLWSLGITDHAHVLHLSLPVLRCIDNSDGRVEVEPR